ncbi:hypothetical protein DKW60_08855 [Leucothrix pacifica]|uniref:Uncharacterized protein n=2 Tax=Leucothrix pacifica TaxID=1247513 RepID=A0A317CNY1_9GAMM|nr:hypothetical protein DKW60_08855 [Leucothrix pacifica]
MKRLHRIKKHVKQYPGSYIFGLFVLTFGTYIALPEPPDLVVYQISPPHRFNNINRLTPPQLGNPLHDSAYACAFMQQQKPTYDCSSNIPDNIRYGLDKHKDTQELLLTDKTLEECIASACNIWLIQTTQQKIDTFMEAKEQQVGDSEKPPVDAVIIGSWENIIPPVKVMLTITGDWRDLLLTDIDGGEIRWPDNDISQ